MGNQIAALFNPFVTLVLTTFAGVRAPSTDMLEHSDPNHSGNNSLPNSGKILEVVALPTYTVHSCPLCHALH
jgi:hypothetical protein